MEKRRKEEKEGGELQGKRREKRGRKSYSLSFVASGSLPQVICCRTVVV